MGLATKQIANVFHEITKPMVEHKESRLETEFKHSLASLPKDTDRRKQTLRRLQDPNEKWRSGIQTKQKKRLHYSMVRGNKLKRAIDQALNPRHRAPIHLWDHSTQPPTLVSEPSKVGDVFSRCLTHLGGDPAFEVSQDTLGQFLSKVPECILATRVQEMELPTLSWLLNITMAANPAKATGEDESNYYIVSLLPHCLQELLLRAFHHVLLCGPPDEWSRARVCLLLKKGDPEEAAIYRPICLIQTLVKLSTAWQCQLLTGKTRTHQLLHLCQHRGLHQHRCGDHIYDVVARTLLGQERLYYLYMDFNKTFNSVPLKALWTVLRGYGLPEKLIASIERLYHHAYEQLLVEGHTTAGHLQLRGVRQGCPLSSLFSFYTCTLCFSF